MAPETTGTAEPEELSTLVELVTVMNSVLGSWVSIDLVGGVTTGAKGTVVLDVA